MANILILTSEKNYVWTSMQEIIPSLVHCWELCAQLEQLSSLSICVEKTSPKDLALAALKSKVIIITTFNSEIANAMILIRDVFKVDSPFIFHLHGLATIGCWPLYKFKVESLMTNKDIFLGTCPGDIKCIELTYTNAKACMHLFPLEQAYLNPHLHPKKLVYVGRISDQKNIESSIKLYLSIKENLHLESFEIFGEEDFLGHPNMGIKSTELLTSLSQYSDQIKFRGFVPREKIIQEIQADHIFISLSTHSDENFGMAALRSLLAGSKAILSDWGGHKILSKHFPTQTVLIPVCLLDKKKPPSVNIQNQFDHISTNLFNCTPCRSAQNDFTFKAISNSFKSILSNIINSNINYPSVLTRTDIGMRVVNQHSSFEVIGFNQRCFENYEDLLARQFLEAYANSPKDSEL